VGQETVELLIVTDGQHDVARNDTDTLVIARGVSGQLEDLSGQVLEDGGEVDGSTNTDARSVLSFAELTVETTDREGETSTE
jgi:hypothetical protein